jgi:hypothetical protein
MFACVNTFFLLTQKEDKILANSIVIIFIFVDQKYLPIFTPPVSASIVSIPTMANAVPSDAPDLDKDEAVHQAKKTWLRKNDGEFLTYAHWSYKQGEQSLEE